MNVNLDRVQVFLRFGHPCRYPCRPFVRVEPLGETIFLLFIDECGEVHRSVAVKLQLP